MDGVQLSQAYEKTVCFLPLSPQEYLVLISLTMEGLKAESTLEPQGGFKLETQRLRIQRLNHRPLHQLEIQRLLVRTLIIYLAKLWDPTSNQDSVK